MENAAYLCIIGHLAEIPLAPAIRRPIRDERTANTRIHCNILLILLVEIIGRQDLRERTQIIAIVLPPHESDIARDWQQQIGIRVAIEDEQEIGRVVERVLEVED